MKMHMDKFSWESKNNTGFFKQHNLNPHDMKHSFSVWNVLQENKPLEK